ncbi:Hypothetical predicted protein [Paramuricea clavata]|uniref:Uncharacterized protein n=1 Tax=Paramuricea clavata TaxID=317549 RepID=A0A7D9EV49_PARCT|nr:Hypothetical predicted protein [Paramuricea clavata]
MDTSMQATFDIYAQYEWASRAKLNRGKSKGLVLGAWKNRVDTPFGIQWVKELSLLCATISAGDYSAATWEAPVAKSKKKAVPHRPARPSARPVNNNHRTLHYNPFKARRVQSLYRISKKRAARQVICDNKPSYSGSVDEANHFFTQVFGEKNVDVNAVKKGFDTLGNPITSDKVSKKLCSLLNSAPGADRVEYCHLKSIDPKGSILCNIYNRCLLENEVPAQWKTSQTVLIHKKNDASDVSNFHPIHLSAAYTSCS